MLIRSSGTVFCSAPGKLDWTSGVVIGPLTNGKGESRRPSVILFSSDIDFVSCAFSSVTVGEVSTVAPGFSSIVLDGGSSRFLISLLSSCCSPSPVEPVLSSIIPSNLFLKSSLLSVVVSSSFLSVVVSSSFLSVVVSSSFLSVVVSSSCQWWCLLLVSGGVFFLSVVVSSSFLSVVVSSSFLSVVVSSSFLSVVVSSSSFSWARTELKD